MNSVADETSAPPRGGYGSVHTGRTLMLGDLSAALEAAGPGADLGPATRQGIVDANVLGKRTPRTRLASWQMLNRLYGLSDTAPATQAFAGLWAVSPAARPQLALLRALERDALLRLSAPWIVAQPPGQAVTPTGLAAELAQLGVVYSDKTLKSVSQNLLSSWTQAGWLAGTVRKQRSPVTWQPAAAAYLLHAAFLQGQRGAALFDTPTATLLGLDAGQLDALAFAASQDRLLSYRRLADVVEITFPAWNGGQA